MNRICFLPLFILAGCGSSSNAVRVEPALVTQTVNDYAADAAVWANRSDPAGSLILGVNYAEAPAGALVVYGMDGKVRMTIAGLDRPNSVDVEYGARVAGRPIDIAVVTESGAGRLRVMRIWPDGNGVEEHSEIPIFDGEQGESAAAVSLYRRPSDDAVYAIVAGRRKLWQYRLTAGDGSRLRGEKVREFGAASGDGSTRALAVDDEAGVVYDAVESGTIRQWHADPDHPAATAEVGRFRVQAISATSAGMGIYARPHDASYTVWAYGNGELLFYNRRNAAKVLKTVNAGSELHTMDVSPFNLGPAFRRGVLIGASGGGRNFLVYRWEDAAGAGELRLK